MLAKLDKDDAIKYMDLCVKSGLWVQEVGEGGDQENAEEAVSDEEEKAETAANWISTLNPYQFASVFTAVSDATGQFHTTVLPRFHPSMSPSRALGSFAP